MKHFERTQDGVTTTVTTADGLAEVNSCMIGPLKKTVRTMSGGTGRYAIEYKDGRKVTLVLKVTEPVTEEDAEYVAEDAQNAVARINGDSLVKTEPGYASVNLAPGRAYTVSLAVARKGVYDQFTVDADYVHYWPVSTAGRGIQRTASEDDKPGSIGGRIWALVALAVTQ
ncbi:hypothetical protein SEA_XKCD426_68 [Streptomyces phage Xkcd426]|nr:hypothetical protein SEA_XKCD426_68 [Streptomyces phage Xkcd426]